MLARLPFGNALALRAQNRLLALARRRRPAATHFGAVMECDLRDFVQSTIYHFGVWEPGLSGVFERIVTPGSAVADVGANVGYYSLLASSLVGPDGSVIAFEPSPQILPTLQTNLSLNRATNIRVAPVAIGDSSSHIPLYGALEDNLGRTSIRSDSGFHPIAIVPLEPLFDQLTPEEAEKLSLIKIDVEGAELAVIQNILHNVDKVPDDTAILVEYSDIDNPEWQSAFAALLSAGLRCWLIDNDYSWRSVATGRRSEPREIRNLPAYHADLLFSRRPIVEVDRC